MDIKLLPGFSRVRMETMGVLNIGGLVLPESLQGKKLYIGSVIDSNMTGKDRAVIGVDDINGKRVLIGRAIGRHLTDNDWIVPNIHPIDVKKKRFDSTFIALFDPDVKLQLTTDGEQKRCRHCGPANRVHSEQNIMLAPHPKHGWYCPRCHRNEHGAKVDPKDII